jgi:Mg-chelatase subunit ChlD
MKTGMYVVALVALAGMALQSRAQEDVLGMPAASQEILLAGGPLYLAWPAADSFMTCGLRVVAPTQKVSRRKPIQVALVVDISKPMAGEPLQYARTAATRVIESLRDGDLFCVVGFSTYARVAFPMQPLSAGVRPSGRSAIDGLGDEDRRNMFEGLSKACEQFGRFKGQDADARLVILLTNGMPDKGVTDAQELRKKAVDLAAQYGACISTFGFHYAERSVDDFDEDFLSAIATESGGRYCYVEDPRTLPFYVAQELDRVSEPTVRAVTVRISPPGQARVENVEGAVFSGDKVLFGDMGSGESRMIVFDLVGRPKRQRDLEITATYSDIDRQAEREARTYVEVPLTSDASRLNPGAAPRLIVYDLQQSLVETSGELAKNRQNYTSVFRNKVKDLEQENVILNSEYIRTMLTYYRQVERDLANTSLENSVVIKRMKFRAQLLLEGK